jgi:hypothetical protein
MSDDDDDDDAGWKNRNAGLGVPSGSTRRSRSPFKDKDLR